MAYPLLIRVDAPRLMLNRVKSPDLSPARYQNEHGQPLLMKVS